MERARGMKSPPKNGADRKGEFALIADVFAPLAAQPEALGLLDDAGGFAALPGHEVVVTTDMLVAGVHFFASDPPAQIARKALRVNLSDLAAMGAVPRFYLLTLALPEDCGDDWLEGFAAGLADDQREFAVNLLGGDTVTTPGPLSLTITALGEVRVGAALRRSGAREGNLIYVSGTIGDAALGLATLGDGDSPLVRSGPGDAPKIDDAAIEALRRRYFLPEPRTFLGPRLLGLASAAIDVSDGLTADLGHICAASGLGATVDADAVPLSAPARSVLDAKPALLELLLSGGDDYELLFTVEPENANAIERAGQECGVDVTRIGTMTAGHRVTVRAADGSVMPLARAGYVHF